MLRSVAALAAVLMLGSAVMAGEKLNIGDKAPTFSGLEATDGKKISSDDFDQKALVVAITCNHCPVAQAYEDRLMAFCKKYGEGDKAGLVAINVSNLKADKLPAMKERAEEKKFNFPYAIDPSQKIARDLGATKTPQFFVFDKDRKLVYSGAFDDNMDETNVKTSYVDQAVQAVLAGTKPPKSTTPMGCFIKFDE